MFFFFKCPLWQIHGYHLDRLSDSHGSGSVYSPRSPRPLAAHLHHPLPNALPPLLLPPARRAAANEEVKSIFVRLLFNLEFRIYIFFTLFALLISIFYILFSFSYSIFYYFIFISTYEEANINTFCFILIIYKIHIFMTSLCLIIDLINKSKDNFIVLMMDLILKILVDTHLSRECVGVEDL